MKKIVIVGEKSVGKSTLFRQIVNKYSFSKDKKIVSPKVNYTEKLIEIENNLYNLIDTPTFLFLHRNETEKVGKKLLEELLTKSDLIIWVIDCFQEKNILLNKYLRKFSVPRILLFNNKNDFSSDENNILSATRYLQPQHFFSFSVISYATNLEKLTKKIKILLPTTSTIDNGNEKEEKKELKLLIFGPPNSGKSTLMNYLLQTNRSLTSPLAGTTQEPVISLWKEKKINFQLVDTAGITKEQKLKNSFWNKFDLAWAVIDASSPLTKQILQIIHLGEKYNKPLIIIVNKLDLITNKKEVEKEIRNRLKSLHYCPLIFLSAHTGQGTNYLKMILEKICQQSQKKFPKKEREKIITQMLLNNPPKYYKNGRLKIYFTKYESGLVPCFIFFVNNPQWIHFSYQRYMINYLRKSFSLEYLPIKIVWKKSN